VQATVSLSFGGKFLQGISHAIGQSGHTPSCRSIVEMCIHPKCPHHLHEVGFTRAEETTDPDGRLLGLIQVLEVGFQNMLKSSLVLALANKGLQLIPEHGHGFVGSCVIYTGDTFVDELPCGWIFRIYVSIFHGNG